MSKKQKMSAEGDFALMKFENTEDVDLNYWANLSKENVKKPAEEQVKASAERQKKIESLYPIFTREQIAINSLVPANEEWNFFPSQENGVLEELMENIAVYGQLSPAIVWEQKNGTYMILGGHTRYQAIKRLHEIFAESGDEEQAKRFETMDCNVYSHDELDEIEARKIIIFDNVIRRENSTAVKARSVITMAQLEKDTRSSRRPDTRRARILDNVASALGESVNAIKKIYQLRELIPEFWPLVDAKDREERITNQVARSFAILPADLQKYIFDNQLYKNKITSQILAGLKKAQSTSDIDELFTAPEIFTVTTKTEITEQLPSNYKPLVVFGSKEELGKLKEIIEWNVCASSEISDQTKNILRKVFASNK